MTLHPIQNVYYPNQLKDSRDKHRAVIYEAATMLVSTIL